MIPGDGGCRLWLPRALAGLFIGAGLGLAGAVFQSLLRNSLASPDIIGVSQGAALGGVAEGIEVTPELARLSEGAAASVGADIGAVDLLECPERGLLVNEVNHSMEFRNSVASTGVDIARRVAELVMEIGLGARAGRVEVAA